MNIQNATVLVTGANRGLGAEFARQALARGAKKVYAAARDPGSVKLEGVVPVRLDVTDDAAVAALARGFDIPKLITDTLVARSFAALETGASEVLVDDVSRAVKQGLTAEPPLYTLA